MKYFCCDKLRRSAIKESALKGTALNGIDYLEVLDHQAPTESARQRTLFVHLINAPVGALAADNVRIEGGERIRPIRVTKVTMGADGDPNGFTVEVDPRGDFSIYTLRLVTSADNGEPPDNFDPLFSAVDFSFKVECPSDFDCKRERICPPEPAPEPEIDYLAKDYASLRRLILDRMSVLMPQWRERHAADLGNVLVDLLAYAGDHLSYQQDAVATEAYLGTARRRVSVRRHARLVDYFMHEGCNARAWVQVQVNAANVALPAGTKLLSRLSQRPARLPENSLADALKERPAVFETMHDALLFDAHNELHFYTWKDQQCCLPRGATSATLVDPASRLRLRAGDVLIFEERLGPNTGDEADASPARRHAVRLTRVEPEADSVVDAQGRETGRSEKMPAKTDALTGQAIVEIEWAAGDSLPFALCISSKTDKGHGGKPNSDVSVARGNIVLSDHGLTMDPEKFDAVPDSQIRRPVSAGEDRCARPHPERVPVRFRPALRFSPLTHAAPFKSPTTAPAIDAMRWSLDDPQLLPAIRLEGKLHGVVEDWAAQRELLRSGDDAREFVVEIESDGAAALRFGDDTHGQRPATGTEFTAHYRVGNGTSGNLGADALYHVVTDDAAITGVRNPLPARGGVEPESMEDVRQRAPAAFRTQMRAVTEADYAEVAERNARVQQAAARFRWTGSWHTVFLTVDRLGSEDRDARFDGEIATHVDRFRMVGHDLEISPPQFVSLEIEMHVCAKPGYFRSDVRAALRAVFNNRVLPDGRRGVFHPDNFTFGQTVYLSPLYAAAQAVPGVASVQIKVFQRQGTPDPKPLADGFIKLNGLEIARLDDDPNFAERGVFRLTMGGGK